MTKQCSVVEDLLPMYHEELLQDDTIKWMEAHLSQCEACRKKRDMTAEPIVTEGFDSPINYEKMMAKNQFKVSLYQILFVGISFFLALRSVILQEDFSFILAYTVLGFLTYIFYKKYRYVTLIAFSPVFLWHIGSLLFEVFGTTESLYDSTGTVIWHVIYVSLFTSSIHLLFAIIGATIGLFTLKLFDKEEKAQ